MKSGLAGITGEARSLTLESPIETVCRAEEGVSLGGFLCVVGGGVAAEHGRSGVPEEELDVNLAGVLFDGPGGERYGGSGSVTMATLPPLPTLAPAGRMGTALVV
ncbi:MAG: hypothetical protein JSU97_00440 [Dehalococcoidia bacterium]|nr:MAG: hypothetical protein JSU97_00440 [Dehalococcoidia bacterium]